MHVKPFLRLYSGRHRAHARAFLDRSVGRELARPAMAAVPEVALRHGAGRPMPAVGVGTADSAATSPETKRGAALAAREVGFRHFDTAALYGTEAPLGEAIAEATRRGLVASREEVFVTTKLWCTQCHPGLVLPSLRESLRYITNRRINRS
jgi:diketogulonate reductase-like aldo/keto reductase